MKTLDIATPNDAQLDAVMGFAEVRPLLKGWVARVAGSPRSSTSGTPEGALRELRLTVAHHFEEIVRALVAISRKPAVEIVIVGGEKFDDSLQRALLSAENFRRGIFSAADFKRGKEEGR